MPKIMKGIAALSLAVTVVLSVWYQENGLGILLSLAITAGTIAYHFVMRLLVGLTFDTWMKNQADTHRRWYQAGKTEMALYEKLQVKKWKGRMPSYDPAQFDPRLHTWEEIAQAMCQAELVHESIVVLSFLPILAGTRFGAYPVFILTSIGAALFDLSFVCLQRYNRQRIHRLLVRERQKDSGT